MADPGIRLYSLYLGDSAAEVSGEIIQTIPVGTYADVRVYHASEATFWLSEITFQTETGIDIEVLEAHRRPDQFVIRITNTGSEDPYLDPYHLSPYGTADQVRVTFSRRGFIHP